MKTFARIAMACAITGSLILSSLAPVYAQTGSTSGRVAGVVVDQTNGLAVSNATVNLLQGSTTIKSSKTNQRGSFVIDDVAAGLYTLVIDASGYQNSQSREFVVIQGQETAVNLAINRATNQQSANLKTIATVSASSANALASTTTITRTIDPTTIQKEGNLRLADSLVRLPGVNGGGLSSSIGDDTTINIRGLGASETRALLDGHPVGPQGVYGINGGGTFPTSFNYANSPITGLSKVVVTFGSGASGLYGVDAIGGTVDMQTLNPTSTPQFNFLVGGGSQGRSQSAITATGSFGRISYALAGGVQGAYGMFFPNQQAQTARPNNDSNNNNGGACTEGNNVSACNLALNTYSFSQNTLVKSGLAKLRYNLSNNTNFTATVYGSGQQSDSTGNGDNDNIPYDTRLAQIQNNVTPDCALPGDAPGTTSGYTVITGNSGATSCYTAQQWASVSSGPFGGGQDRNRGTNMSDYHFRLQSTWGKNVISGDGFYNYYKFYKSSLVAAGLNSTGTQYAGTSYSQFLNTSGWLISDDIQNERSDIGFGYFGQYQLGTRLNYGVNRNANDEGLYSYNPSEQTHFNSGFARASYIFNDKFSAFANFWIQNSTVDHQTNFDPRLSLVFRPTLTDVVRATYGHSTGTPAAELVQSTVNITGNPSSLNPSCTPYNTIAVGGNPNIRAERGNDYELGYAHKFKADSSVQLNLYYTAVGDQLFSAALPLTAYGNIDIPPTLLEGYAKKIAAAGCNVDPNNPSSAIPFLAISTTFNAASAVSKGIELIGRQRFTRQFYVDYTYNLQSVTQNGVPTQILQSNPFIINGGQVQGIPLNQANLALDYSNSGVELRMDGYFVGPNNPKTRPAYNTWDGFVSHVDGHGLTVTLGVLNVFNQEWQQYGYFGHQQFIAENQYNSNANSIAQFINTGSGELYGNPIRSFTLSLSKRI